MKAFKLSIITLLAAVAQLSMAQNLKLSTSYPIPGQKVKLTYNPAGTPLEGKPQIGATLFYITGNVQASCQNINLHIAGTQWEGNFTVPVNSKAFFIKPFVPEVEPLFLHMEKEIDNNHDKGYVYMVYQNKVPVKGAYAAISSIYWGGGSSWGKIKSDVPVAFQSLQKELTLYPVLKADYNRNYILLLANVNKEQHPEVIATTADSLAGLSNEADNRIAITLYKMLKDTVKGKQVTEHIKTTYPNGDQAKVEAIAAIRAQEDADKQLQLFTAYTQRFAANPYPDNKDEQYLYTYMLSPVIKSYVKKGDYAMADQLINKVNDESTKTSYYNMAANGIIKQEKDYATALSFLSKAEAIVFKIKANPGKYNKQTLTTQEYLKFQNADLDESTDLRAMILYKQNKVAEALELEEPVYARSGPNYIDFKQHYALFLTANKQYQKAMDILAALVKRGRPSDEVKTELKKNYVALHQNETGYDEYLAALNTDAKTQALDKMAKTMINNPAPQFALKDFEGKTVSLASLKGKVVVIDFWATWCGPCKASFPGMQMAMNKYKDNPEVKFLFIDTWEKGTGYEPAVKQFIADNKYPFHVVFDETDAKGKQGKVVAAFNVEGIPTKFVIDKTGNIRFKKVGYNADNQKLVEELSAMIDMAAKPVVPQGQKVTAVFDK